MNKFGFNIDPSVGKAKERPEKHKFLDHWNELKQECDILDLWLEQNNIS